MNLERLLHCDHIELEAVETKSCILLRGYKISYDTGEKKLLSIKRKHKKRNRRGYKVNGI